MPHVCGEAYPANRNLDVRVIPLFDHVVGVRTRRGMWLGFAAVLSCSRSRAPTWAACLTRERHAVAASSRCARPWALGVPAGPAAAGRERQPVGGRERRRRSARDTFSFGFWSATARTFPGWIRFVLDGIAVASVFIGGLFVVMLCGTIPALLAAKTDAATAFSVRHPSSLPRYRLQNALVIVQIAGALVLLVNAVLFAQSFRPGAWRRSWLQRRESPGCPSRPPASGYPDAAALAGFFHAAKDRLQRLPGVVAVGAMTDFFIRRNADQQRDDRRARSRAAGQLAQAGDRVRHPRVSPRCRH